MYEIDCLVVQLAKNEEKRNAPFPSKCELDLDRTWSPISAILFTSEIRTEEQERRQAREDGKESEEEEKNYEYYDE